MTRSMEFDNPRRAANVHMEEPGHFDGGDHHCYREYLVYEDRPGDVTGDERRPRETDIRTLNKTIYELSKVIGELKEQLTQHIKLNEALEEDLGRAEARIRDGEREKESLVKRLRVLSEERRSFEDHRGDLDQITRERDMMAEKVYELGKMLAVSEQRVLETGKLIDRFRSERNDASTEVTCLDSQFTRAMKVIEELKHELSATKDRNEELASRLEFVERQKQMITSERDVLKIEIGETRNALEEIRQGILDASLCIEKEASPA
jgi:chromosome segregation ATPase